MPGAGVYGTFINNELTAKSPTPDRALEPRLQAQRLLPRALPTLCQLILPLPCHLGQRFQHRMARW
jgi:hypothetical protein